MNENVKRFQAAAGLGADGLYGPKTAAMAKLLIETGKIAVTGQIVAPAPAPITTGTKRLYQGSAEVDEIILHCTDTRPEWMENDSLSAKIKEIDRWHRLRGFSMIGYHWIIDRDGTVLPGRPETKIGAHVKEANVGTIGISLVGGYGGAATDDFDEHFTAAQRKAVLAKIEEIRTRARIAKISGHNDYAAKACPCFNVREFLNEHA